MASLNTVNAGTSQPTIEFLDRKLPSHPEIQASLKRPDARDALPLELQRHPGARCFVGSGAVQHDLPVARHLLMSLIELLGGNPYRARDHIGRRIHLERRARVDDRQIAVSGIEPALELVGGDARDPETSEEPSS